MTRIVVIIIIGLAVASSGVAAIDADLDGLDDDLEYQLLQANAPHIYIEIGEDDLPCDYVWFIRRSRLMRQKESRIPFWEEVISESQLCHDYKRAIQFTEGGLSSDFYNFRRFPDFAWSDRLALDINDACRCGQSRGEILAARNTGLYGHVTPIRIENVSLIRVQYWQLFAYNDDTWDHEGDWNMFEVFVRESGDRVMQVWYYHGKRECWHLPGFSMPVSDPGWGGFTYQYEHPFLPEHANVYVGANGHEFYPTPRDDCCWDYQTRNVPNIGEVLFPNPGYEVLLHYNGYWGDGGGANSSPEGIMHNSGIVWQWPTMRRKHVDRTGYWWEARGYEEYANGSFGRPYPSISYAIATSTAEPSTVIDKTTNIIIESGNYPGELIVRKPIILRAHGGSVTIGQ